MTRERSGEDQGHHGLQTYRGAPKALDARGERGRWQRFLEWVFPMLRYKYAQAERVVEARVAREEGEALKSLGEGREAMARARMAESEARAQHIGRLAQDVEAELIEDVEFTDKPSKEDLQREVESLHDELRRLAVLYGSEFRFGRESDGVPECTDCGGRMVLRHTRRYCVECGAYEPVG